MAKKKKADKFSVNAWNDSNRSQDHRTGWLQYPPLDTSTYCVVHRNRGWRRSQYVFEIIGRTDGRVFGFLIERNGDGSPVRKFGAMGDTRRTSFSSALRAGYENISSVVAEFPGFDAAEKYSEAMSRMEHLRSEKNEIESEANEANYELHRKRQALVAAAEAKIDAELKADRDAISALRQRAADLRVTRVATKHRRLKSICESLGGKMLKDAA